MTKQNLIELFKPDIEFINNYSIYHPEVKSDLDSVVDDTWSKIEPLTKIQTEYGYFAMDTGDAVPWIVGFYVKPEYRKNNTLVSDMDKYTGGMFLTCVSNTNTRAIKFLSKHCKEMNKDKVKTIFYYMRGK